MKSVLWLSTMSNVLLQLNTVKIKFYRSWHWVNCCHFILVPYHGMRRLKRSSKTQNLQVHLGYYHKQSLFQMAIISWFFKLLTSWEKRKTFVKYWWRQLDFIQAYLAKIFNGLFVVYKIGKYLMSQVRCNKNESLIKYADKFFLSQVTHRRNYSPSMLTLSTPTHVKPVLKLLPLILIYF
jgi:hypothetical protein